MVKSKLIVCECESIRISNQEHGEMAQWISSWVPVPIKSCTLIEDVFSWLDGIVAAWTFEVFIGEESQLIFSN